MAVSPDHLIEKFASMLEEGEHLDSSAFADRACEIIAMISVEPSLNETLNRINAKLHTLASNPSKVQFNALETGTNPKACAANELRALKQSKRVDVIH